MKVGDKLYFIYENGLYNIVEITNIYQIETFPPFTRDTIIRYNAIIEQQFMPSYSLVLKESELNGMVDDSIKFYQFIGGCFKVTRSEKLFLDWLEKQEK